MYQIAIMTAGPLLASHSALVTYLFPISIFSFSKITDNAPLSQSCVMHDCV